MTTRRWPAALVLLAALLHLAAPLAAGPQERQPRKVAFLVGVGKFLHLTDLVGAPQRDVLALEEVLVKSGFEVVKLLDQQATKDGVEGRFKKLLAGDGDRSKALGKGDLLLVALCSHGFTFEVGGKQQPFVAGHDAVKDSAADMISLVGLFDAAKNYGAAKLFLVDACREIVDPNRGVEVSALNLPSGTSVMFSCTKGEMSHQSDELKHGLFTYSVLRALRGESGLAGEVLWTDLVGNVDRAFRSPDLKKHIPAKRTQTPVYASGEGGNVTILTIPKGPPPKHDPKDTPGTVVGGDMAKKPGEDMAKKKPDGDMGKTLPGTERIEDFQYIVNDTGLQTGKRKVLTLDIGGGQKMEFVRVEPGEFLMGAPDTEKEAFATEKPQRKVVISHPFYLGKHEVTQAQYKAVTGTDPSRFRDEKLTLPVDSVSWDDATAFCKTLSDRTGRKIDLPTEAQWEFACRAGTETPFHFGTRLSGDHASHDGTFPYGGAPKGGRLTMTAAVGKHRPNPWGLHDMHGNVFEWCRDYFGTYDKVAKLRDPEQTTPQSPAGERVLRGGSWDNHAGFCRSANRVASPPSARDNTHGFRVCFPAN